MNEAVYWTINSIKLFKFFGEDGIYHILLQIEVNCILPYLVEIFKARYELAYKPHFWMKGWLFLY